MRNGGTVGWSSARTAAAWILCLAFASCAHPPPPPPPAPPPGAAGFRVVALGDSYASGQGAPNEDFSCWNFWSTPSWDDKRCNRSRYAPAAQAVEILRQQDPSIDYVSFACSGAEIEEGLIGPYDGSEPPPGPHAPLPPQVEDLRDLAATSGVDAVTISIGGNDILFAFIVLSCVVGPSCDLLQPLIDLRLGDLPGRLDLLAQDLAAVPGLAPERVFILEYPLPSWDSDGGYCDGEPPGDALAGVTEREVKWVAEHILPRLNRHICEAAQRHGWTYVGGVASRFEKHGWCAQPQNWINTFNESLEKQRHHRGAVHPNRRGHAEVGERLAEAMTPLLAGQSPTSSACPTLPPPP